MLGVYDTQTKSLGEERIVRDSAGRVTFAYLGALAMGSLQAFRLTVDDARIPVLASENRDGETLVYVDVSVSGSYPFESKYGISSRDYPDPSYESKILHTAAECLLVYGGYYDGLTTLRNRCRVELADGSYTLSDFGY